MVKTPGTDSGWQQSRSNWIALAVIGHWARMHVAMQITTTPLLCVFLLNYELSVWVWGWMLNRVVYFIKTKMLRCYKMHSCRWRPYQVECTGSLSTSEVKRLRARLVLGWGTAWEDLRVLAAFLPIANWENCCSFLVSGFEKLCVKWYTYTD